MNLGTVLSTNIGAAVSTMHSSEPVTGHDKQPVEKLQVADPGGQTEGSGSGVAGDFIGDLKHHGGSTQAVYAVSQSELDFWSAQLGRELLPGMFAENLTVAGFDVDEAPIGQQWQVGEDVTLEVASVRIPCRTFAGHLGEKQWVKRFSQHGRPGAYLAVVQPGTIRPGDTIVAVRTPEHGLTVRDMFAALMGDKDRARALLDSGSLLEFEQARVQRKAGL
ncbi:MOSC domain-containing protein [Ornithinimicrobium sp. INDO-MA30-4]|uniref:MOSC domain-containing protein n=1 Tax=Ornithinimicrobium sp. INDO-MA30-4 TaxID=2908651 RepID=UPI001F423188|nr:MOSC domain-containing protein [Ornithinimicrobium sp. INDO-MA30-4]UJH71448.1 MOSC domain-containing protein [Ornithinimicrobium sp. INDO-MA30-4]